jgi:hypothetical protein
MAAFLQTPPQKSNIFLFLIPVALLLVMFILLLVLLLRPALQPPPPSIAPTWLEENSSTEVRLLPGGSSPLYAFRANPAQATLLAMESSTPGFSFAAQVTDESGALVAAFDSRLQVAALSLAPRSGSYQLKLSALQGSSIGNVNVAVGAAVSAQSNPPAAILSKAAPPCQVTPATDAATLVRSAPHGDYEVLTALTPGNYLPVLGRTDDGWYAVNLNERMSWMSQDVTTLVGVCDSVPRLLNPIIPAAPLDPQVYLVEVDRDGGGMMRDAISAMQGDSSDLVWVRAINLYNFAPNNYREYSITVNCTGIGAEYLRWGSPYQPTLRCGETFALPFLYEISQQPIAIVFDANAPQSYVEYMINVVSSTAISAPGSPNVPMDEAGAVG